MSPTTESAAAPPRLEVAIVRQPIADARRNVVGYELLVGGNGRRIDPTRDPKATSALLVDAFGDIGLETLAGTHPAWLSISRDFLVDVGPPPFRPDRAVLQIAAYPAQDDLLGVLQQLGRRGYSIALAQYDGREDITRLLALCSTVKIDVTGRDEPELRQILFAPSLAGTVLVATGVEDAEAFDRCRALGFHYFQGGFLAKPRTVRHRSVATGGVASMRALSELTREDATMEELEKAIAADVGLAIKLLRYVNSAFFSLPRTINSVGEALRLLGLRTVRRWATVMTLAGSTDVPSELIGLALHRARMCEMLASGTGGGAERDALFTVGLFSVVDALLDAPMDEVLETLPFTDEIRAALLRQEGAKGELLSTVLAYERGEFPSLAAEEGDSLGEIYRSALAWVDETGQLLA